MPEENNPYDSQEALVTDSIAESQKEDGTQNGRDGGHEHGEGPETGCGPVHRNIIVKKTEITCFSGVFCPSWIFLTCAENVS